MAGAGGSAAPGRSVGADRQGNLAEREGESMWLLKPRHNNNIGGERRRGKKRKRKIKNHNDNLEAARHLHMKPAARSAAAPLPHYVLGGPRFPPPPPKAEKPFDYFSSP